MSNICFLSCQLAFMCLLGSTRDIVGPLHVNKGCSKCRTEESASS